MQAALLAKESPVEADMVIGVPESGVDAAIGYSEESGIPFQKGIVTQFLYWPYLY